MTMPPLLARDRVAPVVIDADGASHDRARIAATVAAIAKAIRGQTDVILACEDRLRFVHAALAAWSTGAVITLPSNLLPATVEQLAPPPALVLHDGAQSIGLDVTELVPRDGDFDLAWDPARRIVRLSTSGTTGIPKAIDKTAGQLVGEASQLARSFDIAGARVLCTVPPHHIYGLLFGMLVPLVGDATIVAVSALHAEAVLRAIERLGVDVLVSTPAQLRAFDVLDAGALRRLRHVLSSGAPLPADTAAMLRDRLGVTPTEVFGSSETGGIAMRTHARLDPPWVALPGVDVSVDANGCMIVCSPWLDPGAPQPCTTQDRVTLVPGGFVHHGRADDVVKVGGRRVALGDVTAKLRAMPGIDDAAAIAVASRDGRGQAIAAFVATATRSADEVRGMLAQWFDAAVVPRRVVCVPALPREPTGKLVRARLLALLDAKGQGEGDPTEPRRRAVEIGADHAVFDVDIDPSLPCFAGHFPADPILPGAVLLEAVVLRAIEQAWPDLGAPTSVPRAKFTERVVPGDRLRVALDRRGTSVTFAVDRGQEHCALGSFGFASVPKPDGSGAA